MCGADTELWEEFATTRRRRARTGEFYPSQLTSLKRA